jgi:hypothetical protein
MRVEVYVWAVGNSTSLMSVAELRTQTNIHVEVILEIEFSMLNKHP